MKDEWKKLISVAYDVIDEEKLPRPKQIRLRSPLNGTRSRKGSCVKYHTTGDYRIIINTVKARFVPHEDGTYINRKTQEKMRRVIGTPIEFIKLVEALGHEMAHLKFWRHSPQHLSYAEYLANILKQRLGLA